MNPEEIKAIGEKVANNLATAEEKLIFLRELNNLTSELRSDVAEVKKSLQN